MARSKPEHIEFIKNNVGKISVKEMCRILDLKEYQIRYITDKRLGIDLREVGKCRPNWSNKELAILRDPTLTDYEKAKKIPSRTDSAVRMQRRRIGAKSRAVVFNREFESDGYKFVRHNGGYEKESRLVMEREIGRPLTIDDVVHHINGRKSDNSIDNLCLCNGQSHHITIHNQLMEVIAELMDRDVVYFDKSDFKYKVK